MIKTIFDIKDEIWLFFFPILSFYIIGNSSKTIVINNLMGIISFTINWFFCSVGLYVIVRALATLSIYIHNLLDKKRN